VFLVAILFVSIGHDEKIGNGYHKTCERLRFSNTSTGILFVFKQQYVESHGYYFSIDHADSQDIGSIFCTEIAPGTYRYYDPG